MAESHICFSVKLPVSARRRRPPPVYTQPPPPPPLQAALALTGQAHVLTKRRK